MNSQSSMGRSNKVTGGSVVDSGLENYKFMFFD